MVVNNTQDNSDKRRYPPGKSRGSPPVPAAAPLRKAAGLTDQTDIVINQILDLQADGQILEARAVLQDSCRTDSLLAERFDETNRVMSMLRIGDDGDAFKGHPDMTASIIERVERQRVFQPRPSRRRLGTLRPLIASCGFAVLAVVGLMRYRTPDAAQPAIDPRHSLEVAAQAEPATGGVHTVIASAGEQVLAAANTTGTEPTPLAGEWLHRADRYENLSQRASPVLLARSASDFNTSGIAVASSWRSHTPLAMSHWAEPRPLSLVSPHAQLMGANASILKEPSVFLPGNALDGAAVSPLMPEWTFLFDLTTRR